MRRRVRIALDRAQQELDRVRQTELAALRKEFDQLERQKEANWQFMVELERARAFWRNHRTLVEAPIRPEASAVAAVLKAARPPA